MRTPSKIGLIVIILSLSMLVISCSAAYNTSVPKISPQPGTPPAPRTPAPSINVSGSLALNTSAPSPSKPAFFKLNTNISPKGSGLIVPGSGSYNGGSRVNLVVNAKPGYVFDSWGGDAAGTVSAFTITMDSDKSIVAYLKEINPPLISSIATENILENSVTIRWKTDQLSTSQVEYGVDDSYGSINLADYPLTYVHSVILRGLIPQTIYHFKLSSIDQSGNKSTSDDAVFMTKTILDLVKSSFSDSENTDPGFTQQISYYLFNGSSQVITVKKADLIDRISQVQYSITPPQMILLWKTMELKPGDSFKGTIDLTAPHSLWELSNWTFNWYYQDLKANGFITLGNFKPAKK
jgi:uncharacterized repeat protein (TIGR02543 family)